MQIFNEFFEKEIFGHSVLMFGYQPEVKCRRNAQSGFYKIKDSDHNVTRQIPLQYETWEEIRGNRQFSQAWKDGCEIWEIIPGMVDGDFVLSDVGYVLQFSNV